MKFRVMITKHNRLKKISLRQQHPESLQKMYLEKFFLGSTVIISFVDKNYPEKRYR